MSPENPDRAKFQEAILAAEKSLANHKNIERVSRSFETPGGSTATISFYPDGSKTLRIEKNGQMAQFAITETAVEFVDLRGADGELLTDKHDKKLEDHFKAEARLLFEQQFLERYGVEYDSQFEMDI